jgi:hypothetical protein
VQHPTDEDINITKTTMKSVNRTLVQDVKNSVAHSRGRRRLNAGQSHRVRCQIHPHNRPADRGERAAEAAVSAPKINHRQRRITMDLEQIAVQG